MSDTTRHCTVAAAALALICSVGQGQDVKNVIDVIRELEKQPAPKVAGKQSMAELLLISRISNDQYTFDDLLKYAKSLKDDAADDETKNVLGRYVVTLDKMTRSNKGRNQEKNEIKRLIYDLRDQREFAFFTTHDPQSPASKLVALGRNAIPFLIDELENDDLTRSVSPEISTNKKVLRPFYVLKVGDCVYGILKQITGEDFSDSWYILDPGSKTSPKDVRAKAQKWWDSQKQNR